MARIYYYVRTRRVFLRVYTTMVRYISGVLLVILVVRSWRRCSLFVAGAASPLFVRIGWLVASLYVVVWVGV